MFQCLFDQFFLELKKKPFSYKSKGKIFEKYLQVIVAICDSKWPQNISKLKKNKHINVQSHVWTQGLFNIPNKKATTQLWKRTIIFCNESGMSSCQQQLNNFQTHHISTLFTFVVRLLLFWRKLSENTRNLHTEAKIKDGLWYLNWKYKNESVYTYTCARKKEMLYCLITAKLFMILWVYIINKIL